MIRSRLLWRRCFGTVPKCPASATPEAGKIVKVNVKVMSENFGLTTFSDNDIKRSFDQLSHQHHNGDFISVDSVEAYLESNRGQLSPAEQTSLSKSVIYALVSDEAAKATTTPIYKDMFSAKPTLFDIKTLPEFTSSVNQQVNYSQFHGKIRQIGETIDTRVWPVALCNTCK